MKNNTKLADRIKQIRLKNQMSSAKFAEYLDISQGTVSFYESGKTEPSAQTIKILIEKFQIDPYWLLTGKTKNKIKSPTSLQLAEIADKLTEESRLRILDIAQRELLLEEMLKAQEMKKAASD